MITDVRKVPISEIIVEPGRRVIDADFVEKIAGSISESGLLHPIAIDRQNVLIAGLHRIEAVKLLGWTEISCVVCDLRGLEAELARIDENIVRVALTHLELSEAIGRRKEIYENLHPETRAGLAQAAGMNRARDNNVVATVATTSELDSTETVEAEAPPKPFYKDAAEKLNISPRKVRTLAHIAKNISQDVKNLIEGSGVNITQKNLTKLARLPPEQQMRAAEMLIAGQIQSVDEYLSTVSPDQGDTPQGDGNACEKEDAADSPKSTPPGETPKRQPVRTTKQIIADLKRTDKDCTCTSSEYVSAFAHFADTVLAEIDAYGESNYGVAIRCLTQEQMDFLRKKIEAIRTSAAALYKMLKRSVVIDG